MIILTPHIQLELGSYMLLSLFIEEYSSLKSSLESYFSIELIVLKNADIICFTWLYISTAILSYNVDIFN